MLQNQPIKKILRRLPGLPKWLLRDPAGQTFLLRGWILSMALQLCGLEFEYGLQCILYLFTLTAPILILLRCLISPQMWQTVRSESLNRSLSLLLVTLLSGIWVVGILPIIIFLGGYPNPSISQIEQSNGIVVATHEYDDISGIGDNSRVCKYRIEYRRAFPGVLYKLGEDDSSCKEKNR
jgi:hypothetical protein